MNLYHYYDSTIGPFKSISDVSAEQANKILKEIAEKKPNVKCAKRDKTYLAKRYYYENILRDEFIKKGGIIKKKCPHYMVVERSPWLSTWFEHSASICIPIEKLDTRTISFTYGDSHPTFSDKVNDGKEYRKKLYTYEEIIDVIDKYGMPQDWNDDGSRGPERYIEAHVWSDEVVNFHSMRMLFEIDTKDYNTSGSIVDRPSARAIIVRDGKIAMVHSKKYNYYKFPGGGISRNETNEAALVREVMEETGLSVIKDSIKEFGQVHRIQKGDWEDVFIQDNYYYLCDVMPGIQAQNLDEYEMEEGFELEYVCAEKAIMVNRANKIKEADQIMLEREAKVLEILMEY